MDERRSSPEWLEAANFNATVADLLTTVVHQVNNALQTIGGHAELLKSEPGASVTTVRRAETIAAVTARIAGLLADVQVLARPRGEVTVADVRAVVEKAVALRQYSLARAKIRARIEGGGITLVSAETHALLQVVLNLILNAEQALAPVAGGRIEIAVHRLGDFVVLQVDDSGASPEPSRATLAEHGRLGLGLTVAETIVGRFGGQLSMAASPEGGTRVSITLPAAPESRDASAAGQAAG